MEIMKAVLGLEDGTYVTGEGFGVEGECRGELVFSTQMTGYMEALTDPSYFGQMLLFTYLLLGIMVLTCKISRQKNHGRSLVLPVKYVLHLPLVYPCSAILKITACLG